TARKYGYAKVGFGLVMKYGDVFAMPRTPLFYAQRALIRKEQVRILIKYKQYLLDASAISLSLSVPYVISKMTPEGLRQVILDPEIDLVAAEWDEIQYYDFQKTL